MRGSCPEEISKRACATAKRGGARRYKEKSKKEGTSERERERKEGLLLASAAGGGKEEMGHIKGSLGHGGWYLTQIHIFHSDGRGTVEGRRQGERVGCVWVVGLPEHAGGGWVARSGATRRGEREAVGGRKSCALSVCTCARVCARVEWVGIRVDRTGLVRSCRRVVVRWYAGVRGAGASPPPFALSPPTPV